jgi:hypothetical protein
MAQIGSRPRDQAGPPSSDRPARSRDRFGPRSRERIGSRSLERARPRSRDQARPRSRERAGPRAWDRPVSRPRHRLVTRPRHQFVTWPRDQSARWRGDQVAPWARDHVVPRPGDQAGPWLGGRVPQRPRDQPHPGGPRRQAGPVPGVEWAGRPWKRSSRTTHCPTTRQRESRIRGSIWTPRSARIRNSCRSACAFLSSISALHLMWPR